MRFLTTFLVAMLLCSPIFTFAQQQRDCGTMDRLDELVQEDPEMLLRMEQIEEQTRDFIENPSVGERAVITIPTVVHVLYRTNAENISDAQILSQIDVLNEDFRRTNADADNTWSQAADTEIEFCLATVDPNGNPTNGITRKYANKRSWRTNDDMKRSSKGGTDAWDTGAYLNIWVCNLSNSILGYAQFPGGAAATDGVVCLYSAFGRVGTLSANFNLGRTTTHEVGHWLNLRHIWGDGPCSADDFVSDTPESDGANYGCAEGHVSCGSVDMVQNYMDYSNDACMNLFTQGQKSRMLAVLNGVRSSLLSSNACGGGSGPTPTCSDGVQNGNETGVDCGGDCAACPPSGSCDAPSGLYYQSKQNGRRATLSWSAVGAADSYTVGLREAGSSSWTESTVSGIEATFTGLTKNNNYEWQVRSNCGSDNSAYASASFTAGTSGRYTGEVADIHIYPNPANNILSIELNVSTANEIALAPAVAENLQISVIDVYGKLMYRTTVSEDQELLDINVNTLSNGMYFLRVETEDGAVQTERFIVSH